MTTREDSARHRLKKGRGEIVALATAGLVFAILSVALTWPLATQLDEGIPLGTEKVGTVPLFNLWTLAWNVESFGRLYDDYWQAPIFHPARAAFALSEPQPLLGFVAVLLTALGLSLLEAYNVILLGCLTLNGWLAAAGLRWTGLGLLPAFAGGCLVLVLPFVHQELGVLHLVPLAGVLALAAAVWRFALSPRLLQGLLLGVALALAYGLGMQVAVFGVIALAPAALWLWWPHRKDRRAWSSLAAGALVFLLLVSPVLLAQAHALSDEDFERSLETVRRQSAELEDYRQSAWPAIIPVPGVETAERPSGRAFWPGLLRLTLAVAAIVAGWRSRDWRRAAVAGGLVLLTSFVLSFGANVEVVGRPVVEALRAVPGFSQIRSYFRFALFVQLAIMVLAALGLELSLRAARERLRPRWAQLAIVVLALVAVLEIRPAMGEILILPPLDLELSWLSWIEESTRPTDVLAFVPFPQGRTSADYLGTSQWMYWQMRHWRPMVNGYSGFFPERFRELKKPMKSFPSEESLLALHEAGVRYCVVHRAFTSRVAGAFGALRLEPVFRDDQHGIDVFELVEKGREPPDPG